MENIAALILAGGRSTRIGFPKPWLHFDDENNYLEHLVNLYSLAGVSEIIVVINSDFCTKDWHDKIKDLRTVATIIENDHPDRGRLRSVSLGIGATESDYVFIQNVDSPYIGAELIRRMELDRCKNGTSIPVLNGKKGSSVVKGCLLENHSEKETLRDVLNNFEQKLVETNDEGILINVNTRSQYQQYSGRSLQ